jgi:hypothetical protein
VLNKHQFVNTVHLIDEEGQVKHKEKAQGNGIAFKRIVLLSFQLPEGLKTEAGLDNPDHLLEGCDTDNDQQQKTKQKEYRRPYHFMAFFKFRL